MKTSWWWESGPEKQVSPNTGSCAAGDGLAPVFRMFSEGITYDILYQENY